MLQSLATEICDVSEPSDIGVDVHPALEELIMDSQTAALLTAVMASIANKLREPGTARSPAEMQTFLPNRAIMGLSRRVVGRQTGLSAQARAAVTAFYSGIEPAQRETERYFADSLLMGAERAAALHHYSLSRTWRRACASASAATEALSLETAELLPKLYFLNAGVLGRLLRAAAHGEAPCIDADGKPFLPPLPQRRRAVRKALGQGAILCSGGQSSPVIVRDISQGGLGLERVLPLAENEPATVELVTGRLLSGAIAWSKLNRAGLRFTEPLAPNDPLLWV